MASTQNVNWLSKLKFILLVCSCWSAVGCTTFSKKECQQINWQDQGKVDGYKGRSLTVFGEYRDVCAKHGVHLDLNTYMSGRNLGLQLFCTEESGYQYGLKGQEYAGVCPTRSEPEFMKGYLKGKREYLQNTKAAQPTPQPASPKQK